MGTIANAKVTHYYNCYNGDFIGCLLLLQYEALICSQSEQKYDETYFAKLEKDYEYLKGAPMPCCYSEDELDDVM